MGWIKEEVGGGFEGQGVRYWTWLEEEVWEGQEYVREMLGGLRDEDGWDWVDCVGVGDILATDHLLAEGGR